MKPHSKTISIWKSGIILCLGVGLLALGISVLLQTRTQYIKGFAAELPKPVATIPAAVGFGNSFDAPNKPVRLIIPSINVDAAIQGVGLATSGDMGIPTNFTDVGWYSLGTVPGMVGSAVIDGHLDGKKTPRAVFYDLDKLKKGDLVEVIDQAGTILKFKVVDSKIYDYNASSDDVFSADTSKARLNLITCTGDWMKNKKLYNKRIVVFTELIGTY